jgi:hypothetical protein
MFVTDVRESDHEALDGWPTASELKALTRSTDLVFLPDRVEETADGTVVAFREEAQPLRIEGQAQGLTVTLFQPPDSTLAAFREDAAVLVLPIIFISTAVVIPVVNTLISNRIQRWIDQRAADKALPAVSYREAHIVNGEVRVREIVGSADAVLEILRAERPGGSPPTLEQGDEAGQ